MGNGGGEGGGSTTGLLFRCLLGRILPAALPNIRPISLILGRCSESRVKRIKFLSQPASDPREVFRMIPSCCDLYHHLRLNRSG